MDAEEFRRLAATYNVVPVSASFLADTLTPVSAYLRLRSQTSGSFLFESVEGGERFGRYSFLGADPIASVSCRGGVTTVVERGASGKTGEDLFAIVNGLTGRYRQPPSPGLPPFKGGLVGFIGYDAVRFVERIPDSHPAGEEPDSVLALFSAVLAFDHLRHEVIIIVNALVDPARDPVDQYREAVAEIGRLASALWTPEASPHVFHSEHGSIREHGSRREFEANVAAAQKNIAAGDIFQVVLSQRFSTAYTGDTFNVYRALRVVNPSPYLYYLALGGVTVIGSSPEILVRKVNGVAETVPIAGTRPRGRTEEEDQLLERELLADAKERAEHVMLVDLGRNDLGKVCRPGTVRVEQLMSVVRYSHVMHLASRVTGRVEPGSSAVDVLRAAFPAGTVSGAPKIRAMEIIDSLESCRRGLYAGGVGYFDFSGNMDMCIAIRTMIASNGRIQFQAGAGIVADSDPAREYQEALNKARALVEALRMAEGEMR